MLSKNYEKEVSSLREKIRKEIKEERKNCKYCQTQYPNKLCEFHRVKNIGFQEGRNSISCQDCKCCKAQNHLCNACLSVFRSNIRKSALKELITFLDILEFNDEECVYCRENWDEVKAVISKLKKETGEGR